MIFAIVILAIVVILLLVKIGARTQLDTHELHDYEKKLEKVKQDYQYSSERLSEAEEKYVKIIEQYTEATSRTQEELDKFFEDQSDTRQKALDETFKAKQAAAEAKLQDEIRQLQDSRKLAENNTRVAQFEYEQFKQDIEKKKLNQQEQFDGLLQTLQLYDKEQQQKLFYTIQVPEEFRSDIDYLLNVVSQKVRHPDVINKLVWTEYIRPYILETFKRVGIEPKPGIYKLTNIDTGRAYIGKSTDIKKRIADHFKSSVGITTIADQAVHHDILKTGLWNWAIECVVYCDIILTSLKLKLLDIIKMPAVEVKMDINYGLKESPTSIEIELLDYKGDYYNRIIQNVVNSFEEHIEPDDNSNRLSFTAALFNPDKLAKLRAPAKGYKVTVNTKWRNAETGEDELISYHHFYYKVRISYATDYVSYESAVWDIEFYDY